MLHLCTALGQERTEYQFQQARLVFILLRVENILLQTYLQTYSGGPWRKEYHRRSNTDEML